MRRLIALLLVALALPLAASAAEKSITLPADHAFSTLRPGDGADVTRYHCSACHSTDYIVTQPRGDARQWQAEVMKMISVFGAAISPEDARTIADYLTRMYGRP
jgi:hypothetical protein